MILLFVEDLCLKHPGGALRVQSYCEILLQFKTFSNLIYFKNELYSCDCKAEFSVAVTPVYSVSLQKSF